MYVCMCEYEFVHLRVDTYGGQISLGLEFNAVVRCFMRKFPDSSVLILISFPFREKNASEPYILNCRAFRVATIISFIHYH